LLGSEFLETGANSDSKTDTHGLATLTAASKMLGAFKTPPLRGVADTAPYGHGGTLGSLIDVAKNYGTGGVALSDSSSTGTLEPWLPKFDSMNQQELPTFLSILTAPRAP
jgi:cytochrome c peroxidase